MEDLKNFKKYIENWILQDLSITDSFFNNLPKCPYAKKALVSNKILYDFSNHTNIYKKIDEIANNWNNFSYEVVLIKMNDDIDPILLKKIKKDLNKNYDTFIFLTDHLEVKEKIENMSFNNMKYNIIFMQDKLKLKQARINLNKKGYYKNWSKKYINQVEKLNEDIL